MYSLTMTKALIIGAGIAGPVAAMALQRAGLEPVVYEAYDRGSDGAGSFLTLAANGLAALELLDIRLDHLGLATPTMVMVSRGRELASAPMRARTVARTDLYQALRDEAVHRGIPIEYERRLVDAERTPAGVRVSFSGGAMAEGDLLVGADGLRSRTRSVIDPRAPKLRHVGLLNVSGYARGVAVPGEPGAAYFVFGRRCFFGYLVHPDGDVWWFANPPARREPGRDELRAITPEQWRARLVDLFRADSGPMLDIIAATRTILPGWNTYDLPRVPTWHTDRMVLIGDAVHATSPSSGQGASLAVEDAVVLAKCLRDVSDPSAAFATFAALRRERVERIVAHGKRSGDGKAQGRVGAAIRDLVLPMVMRRMDLSWMHDYRIDWAAPVSALR